MEFKIKEGLSNFFEILGFLGTYSIFTLVMFLVLRNSETFGDLTIFHVFPTTILITTLGYCIKKLLQQ